MACEPAAQPRRRHPSSHQAASRRGSVAASIRVEWSNLRLPAGWKQAAAGEYHGPCPFQSGSTDTFWVRPDAQTLGCRRCSPDDEGGLQGDDLKNHAEDLGIWSRPRHAGERLIRSHVYHWATGAEAFEVLVKIGADGSRNVPQRHRGPTTGVWVWRRPPGGSDLVYRLPAVLAAVAAGRPIWVVEGEKDADSLAGLGHVATTNPGGAPKWRPAHAAWLRGAADVRIVGDDDTPGRQQIVRVAQSLQAAGIPFTVRQLWAMDGETKEDVSDWVAQQPADQAPQLLEALPVRDLRELPGEQKAAPAPAAKPDAPKTATSEADLADVWIQEQGDDWRWRLGFGWCRWTPAGWNHDIAGAHLEKIADLGRRVFVRLGNDGEPKPDPRSGGRKSTAMGSATLAQDRRCATGWDTDPDVLGLPDGHLVNLHSGEVRRRTRDDLIMRSATAIPAARINSRGAWATFLREAVPRDALAWLQVVAGYAATAYTREHLLLFIHGPAGAGKGTFLTVVANALGDYARRVDPGDLMDSQTAEQHPAWLADLDGRRLVVGDELKRNSRWNTARVKALVSGEPIRARRMRQDFYEFKPTAQVILAGNHAPTLASRDTGLTRRLRVLPFTHLPERPDPRLESRIDNGEVLRWIVEGAAVYLRHGLPAPPAAVLVATATNEADSDPLAEFVAENVGEWERGKLYQQYSTYAESQGGRKLSRRMLLKTLREDYSAVERSSNGSRFILLPALSKGNTSNDLQETVQEEHFPPIDPHMRARADAHGEETGKAALPALPALSPEKRTESEPMSQSVICSVCGAIRTRPGESVCVRCQAKAPAEGGPTGSGCSLTGSARAATGGRSSRRPRRG